MNAATIFVHGFNGGVSSTGHMISAAQHAGWAKQVMTATISRHGRIFITGSKNMDVKNPIIQVIFENNRAPEFVQINWLHSLLIMLKREFNIMEYNGVGHSLGSNDLVNEALMYGDDLRVPKLKKLVTIAGPFNGLRGFLHAKPVSTLLKMDYRPVHQTKHFKRMLKYRDHFPKGVDLFNVVGKVEGYFDNDCFVSVNSARSVKYLLHGVLNNYRELLVTGEEGYHCSLNHNPMVFDAMNEFLWNDYATLSNVQTHRVLADEVKFNEAKTLATNAG
ncbi:alpha/beta hydrolase [Pediococcus siamensis]|uniref:alpha/beta hydrolase n=1 Tax=Pediococcus siamensis TaxID=381829 RepID=UPI0039A0B7FF